MHTIIHPSGEDDTQAVACALAHEGSVAELVSGCTYAFGHLCPPHGSTIMGFGSTNYTEPKGYNTPRIVPAPGATAVFDFSDPERCRGVTMMGFTIDGLATECTAISGGSEHLFLDRLYIVNCLDGVGGSVAGSSSYSCVMIARHCKIMRCSRHGISSPVDSEFDGCIVADCGTSYYALPGANHNRIRGGRCEWSKTGEHFRLAGDSKTPVRDWTFGGSLQMDRAATCSVFLRHCHHIQFGGDVASERPGRAGMTGPAQSAHIYAEDSSVVTATGVLMWAGANDDGSGVFSPQYAYEFAGVNPDVILSGGCVHGGYTGPHAIHYANGCTPAAMPRHRITGVGGLADFHH